MRRPGSSRIYRGQCASDPSPPELMPRQIAVLGAPIDIGASQRGTLMGPAALRTAGLLTLLDALGFEVQDHGDLSIGGCGRARRCSARQRPALPGNPALDPGAQPARRMSWRGPARSRSFSAAIIRLSMGSVNGIARHWRESGRELFVIWLDAHADYNTPATTLSANMHGMSAAFLCGEPGLDGLLGEEPRASIDPDRLELFGIALDRQTGKGPAAPSPHQRCRYARRSTSSGLAS